MKDFMKIRNRFQLLFSRFFFRSRHLLPKRLRSGTTEYPSTEDVIAAAVHILAKLGKTHIIYFRTRKNKWVSLIEVTRAVVKLSKNDYHIEVHLAHKNHFFEEDVKKGKFVIPESFKVKKLTMKKGIFHIEQKEEDAIAPFLALVFEKLYNCPYDYSLVGEVTLAQEGG